MADDAIKTVVGEIMRIAVEHGYEGTQIKTITGAIDALADTLAGSDVDSGQTVAQAVGALAPYIGGSGGVELGNPTNAVMHSVTVPVVGESPNVGYLQVFELYVGTQQIVGDVGQGASNIYGIASGATVTYSFGSLDEGGPLPEDAVIETYVVTIDPDEWKCTSVSQTSVDYVVSYNHENDFVLFTLVQPELSDNEYLVFYVHWE